MKRPKEPMGWALQRQEQEKQIEMERSEQETSAQEQETSEEQAEKEVGQSSGLRGQTQRTMRQERQGWQRRKAEGILLRFERGFVRSFGRCEGACLGRFEKVLVRGLGLRFGGGRVGVVRWGVG